MRKLEEEMKMSSKPFYISQKFWFAIVGILAVLCVAYLMVCGLGNDIGLAVIGSITALVYKLIDAKATEDSAIIPHKINSSRPVTLSDEGYVSDIESKFFSKND